MKLEYKVKVTQREDRSLVKDMTYKDPVVAAISDEAIHLRSPSEFIGTGFLKQKAFDVKHKKINDYLYGYENLKETLDIYEVKFPLLNIKNFMNTYSNNLARIVNDVLPQDMVSGKRVRILECKDNEIGEVNEFHYTLDFDRRSIVFNDMSLFESSTLLFFYEKEEKLYEKTSDNLEFSIETLLRLKNGYYNLLPKKVSYIYSISKDGWDYIVDTEHPLKLVSEYNVNFDGISAKEYACLPKTSCNVSYRSSDITPLIELGDMRLRDGYKYIIYEVINKRLIKRFCVDETTSDEDLDTLLNSHEEYKLPYVFIANISEVKLINMEGKAIKSLFVNMENFEMLCSDYTPVPDDGHIHHNYYVLQNFNERDSLLTYNDEFLTKIWTTTQW